MREGWLNRLIGLDQNDSPLQAFNVGGGVPPASLYGPEAYVSAGDVASMRIPGDDEWDPEDHRLHSLHRLWDTHSSTMGRAMRATFRAVEDFGPVLQTSDQPANGAVYPDNDLAGALAETARIIRGDVGVEVVTVDQGDWDHHAGLGTAESGRLRRSAGDLAGAVAAFFKDLGTAGRQGHPGGDAASSVAASSRTPTTAWTTVTATSCSWPVPGSTAASTTPSGRVWPGSDDSDLLVTTDYRSVLAEVVAARFGADTSQVFPGFLREAVGVMAGA